MARWDWSAFFEFLSADYMLRGAWTTVWLTLATMAIAIVIGLVASIVNDWGNPVGRAVYFTYTTLIRGTPLLMQLVFVYTVLPTLGVRLTLVQSALLALSVNEGAYVAEVIRSGINSIPRGQREAARASGFSYWRAMRVIVVPQALRVVVPALGNQVNAMFKHTSLVSVISLTELFRVTEEAAQENFRYFEVFAAAGIFYLAMTGLWTAIQRVIESRVRIPGSQADIEAKSRASLKFSLAAGGWG